MKLFQGVIGLFSNLYKKGKGFILFFVKFFKRIQKIRKRYRFFVKVKNGIIKLLSMAASIYEIFTKVEPFLKKDSA